MVLYFMRKYDNFCKALNNLKEGTQLHEPYNIAEQTGMIGLFEICFEQSWKMMKELLERHGRSEQRIGSPRTIIKIAYQCGMISNEEGWLAILNTRNTLAHTYSDELSLETIRNIKENYLSLFENLKNEVDNDWLNYDEK
ncbi:hypothetical protein C820_002576 [Clostridium sp. MD294]|nr:hypothetical protein C820_002576 [Clostridium sp. MD294]